MIDFSLYGYELRNVVINMIHCEYPQAQQNSKGYSIRCPICGDNPRKKRGIFLLDREPYMYVCHNGDCDANEGIHVSNFLKKYHRNYHDQWIDQVVKASRESEEKKRERMARVKRERFMVERRLPTKTIKDDDPRLDIVNFEELIKENADHMKHFKSILDFPDAVKWCQDRKISESIYNKWLYADKGSLFGRVIIPFDDKNGKMYFYQARSIIGHEPKYRNCKTEIRPIFNYYQVDMNKPVIVLEGPIDSLFVENSIATLGTKYNPELIEMFDKNKLYFIFDDDDPGRATALKHLQQGYNVFMWKSFIKNFGQISGKLDFNDLAIKLNKDKFTFDELKPFFTTNMLLKGLL